MLKTGNVNLIRSRHKLNYTSLDFWRWNFSDLLSNTTIGEFSEFIVASAVNHDVNQLRNELGAFNLVIPNGIKVELKSAAFVQSWT